MNKEMLMDLAGSVVRVDRGGPESRIGMLISVEDDYFTLLTKEDGLVYYRMQHIKSLTHDSKSKMETEVQVPENFEFFTGNDFQTCICNMKHCWVKINRGGHEKLEGVLDEICDDYVTIIAKEQIIHVAMFHIRNMSYGLMAPEETQEGENGNNNNSNNRRRR